ncbi:MAG: hypothetical protein Q8O67_25835 [Deltaproteobacteria bacterium]|nr:hypothetical protein [Deltaproteobacteria bacterium]
MNHIKEMYVTDQNDLFKLVLSERISLRRGLGHYTIIFPAEWRLEGQHGFARISAVSASLLVKSEGKYCVLGRGIVVATQATFALEGNRARSGSLEFEVDLLPAQMAELEEVRSHDGITFDLSITLEGGASNEPRLKWDRGNLRRTYEQSAWVRALNEAKFSESVLIQVPSLSDRDPRFKDVDEAFRESQAALLTGRYEDCVSWGRKTLERLETALNDAEAVKNIINGGNFGEWAKSERVQFVRRAVKQLAHPSAHGNKNALEHTWNRDDATALVLLQAAVLRLTGR